LFLKIIPKQVEIFIDGKLKKKTDFFFGSALIENLLPKKYKVQVKKEGYYPWEKNLEVREKEVNEAKNVVLIPENPNFGILTEGVKNFWFSPDGREIILSEENKQGWALKLYDLEKNVKSHLIEEKDVYSKGADLLGLEFSPDSKEVSLEVDMKEQIKHFALEIDKIPPVLAESEEPLPPLEDALVYKTIGQDVYYLNNLGHLFKNEEKLTEEPFPVKPETEYTLEIFPDFVFLGEGQILYQFNSDSKSFEKFFEPIKDLKISPDYKKIVYFSDYEIWILFLKETADQPQRKAGDRLFLIRLSEQIKDCFWFNSDYLVFNAGDKIKIAEIDDRDRINVVDTEEFANPKMFWNQFNKKLYVLSDGNLYQSEKLLP
jgi:WD40 repeat protein